MPKVRGAKAVRQATKRGGGSSSGGTQRKSSSFEFDLKNDEDIDDDIAFDSDDEKKFGAFFKSRETAQRKLRKSVGKARYDDDDGEADDMMGEDMSLDDDDDDDFVDEQFGKIDRSTVGKARRASAPAPGEESLFVGGTLDGDDNDDHDDDDDSRDEIDISELLDSKEERRKNKSSRREAASRKIQKVGRTDAPVRRLLNTEKEGTVATARGGLSASATGASIKDLMLGTTSASSAKKNSSIIDEEEAEAMPKKRAKKDKKKINADDDDVAAASAEESDLALSRVDKLMKSKLVYAAPVDEYTKEKNARAETREVVGKDMKQWKEFLRRQKSQRTLKFPLQEPDANPVPATLGGIANAMQVDRLQRRQEEKEAQEQEEGTTAAATTQRPPMSANEAAARRLAESMDDLLGRSGLGTTAIQKQIHSEHMKEHHQQQKQQRRGEETGRKRGRGDLTHAGDGEGFVALEDEDAEPKDAAQDGAADINYVRKLKAMLSYEVAKRRRFNKIKSKTYRRILRKEKERQQQKRDEALALLDPDAAKKKMQTKLERVRAEERMTQRHKNTSKWVQHVKKFSKFDEDTRDAISGQHAKHQQLMQKAMDADADDELEQAAAHSHAGSEEEERRVDDLMRGAPQKSVLWGGGAGADGNDDDDAPAAGPFGKARKDLEKMSFMQRGKAQQQKELEADFGRLQEDVERHKRGLKPAHYEEGDSQSDEEAAHLVSAGGSSKKKAAAADGKKGTAEDRGGRKKFGAVPSESDGKKGAGKQQQKATTTAAVEPTVQIEPPSGFTVTKVERPNAESRRNKKLQQEEASMEAAAAAAQPPSDAASPPAGTTMKDYLISRAFAEDEVDQDFLKLKRGEVDTVMKPQDKNASLPGWGEWGGDDKELNQQHQERVAKADLARRIEQSTLMKARVDATLDHAIINHNVDLIPDKHMLHVVPRPFENAKQFHTSMRQPLGPDWNTGRGFKEGVAPKVITKRGAVITPVSKTTGVPKKAKTSRRKVQKEERLSALSAGKEQQAEPGKKKRN